MRRQGNTMRLRFNTRKQLIDALEARREWAERYDADQARTHRAKEDEVLKEFRAKCRELGKANLVQLKDAVENMSYHELRCPLPDCPMSAVAQLDEALAALSITKQEAFVLNGDLNDPIYRAHWLLTAADRPKNRTVCA